MSNEPDIDPGGTLDGDELFVQQVDPSTSGELAGQPSVAMPHYMVAEDSVWVQPLSDIIYQEDISTSFDDIQYEELQQTVGQQILSTGEDIYLMPDEDRDFNEMRESVESLQVAAHEVVVDEMMQPEVEPTEYVQTLPRQVVRGMPTYVRTIPQHAVRPAPSQIVTVPGSSRVRYIVQQTPQPYGVQPSQHVQYEMRPKAMFEGPSNQAVIPIQQRPAPTVRSRSKSQPRRPIFGDLEDEEMAFLVQEYDEGEWDGVELEDHEYFVGERAAIMAEGDEAESSGLPAIKMQQRPYFPPNLTPTEKKEYLLVNYKKACERYFPFANVAMLEADTIYKPVEAFASDLYRFHSRGAHIHGFFRTVIDTRDPPSHDQTRYIQDIQFGKVFPLFPDYEEWDDKMRDDFRQLTSRLLRVFERKYFYANAGGGHGQAPAVKRGPKPQPKPPRDYAEQQKVGVKTVPKGFQAVRATSIQPRMSASKPMSQATVISQPIATATRLTQLPGSLSMNEHVVVPDDVGAARVEAFEHNKRADVKRLVNDAFVAREQANSSYIEYEAHPSNSRTFMCRVPPGPSKTLRHQRSTGSKAMRMIHNRTIEPTIDPLTGRYVVSLEDIRSHVPAPPPSELTRYVQRPVHTLREMADSARRGGPSYAAHAVVRPQGARISRIDQAPRFNYNSASMTTAHHLSNSSTTRAPILRNATGAPISRMTGVLSGNAVAQAPAARSEHVYPRSHSSGRNVQPPSSAYKRSASSGRPGDAYARKDVDDDPYIQVDDSEIIEVSSSDAQDPMADNQVPAKHPDKSEPALSAVPGQSRAQEADQNTAPSNAAADDPKAGQKRTVLLRDEKGRLRRGIKLPDGTILLRVAEDKGAEAKPREPTAGGVYAMHSMTRKDDKKVGRRGEQQWKRLQAPVTPWSHPPEAAAQTDGHAVDLPSNAKTKSRRKDLVQSEDDDDVLLISESRQGKTTKKTETASKRRGGRKTKADAEPDIPLPKPRSYRRGRFLTRHCPITEAVPHRAVSLSEEKRQTFLRNRLLKQEEEDVENIFVDVVSVDASTEESVRELIASAPPAPPGSELEEHPHEQHDMNDTSRERKKAGRPHKRFRGRLAKQKQAQRDAEIAEKVAIKHRELPVLDLALKVIDDPTVEIPVEAPILLDPSIAIDAALLHEVGEVLKEMVAQVSLEELEPKRDIKARTRRNWNYLPERVRSKRQEYKNLNVPVNERSPPPPPLKNKPRGRNSEKYRLLRGTHAQHHDEGVSPGDAANADTSQPKSVSSVPSKQKPEEFPAFDSPATDFLQLFDVDHSNELHSSSEVLNNEEHDLSFENGPEEHVDIITRAKDDAALSSAEESVNDEDLVDVNVETFFSDSFNVSTSGDEEDTPSQKLRKWQECINDVTRRTPISSPSKTKHSEADKLVRKTIVDSSRICSLDQLRTDQVELEVKLVVAELIATVASGIASGETTMSSSYTQQTTIPCDKRHSDVRDSGGVCHMVETIIDALELSLKTNEMASPVVEESANVVHDIDYHYFQCEAHTHASASFIASNASLGFDDVPVSAHELGVENVAAMVEEDLAKEDRRISAIEQELIADSLMFEAQRQAQQSSSSQSFATTVVEGDRLNIAADVDVAISPVTGTDEESSVCHCIYVRAAEQATRDLHWEENSTEAEFSLEKKIEDEVAGCALSIPVQEMDLLHVVEVELSLSPRTISSEELQSQELIEKETEQSSAITIEEPPLRIDEKCFLDVSELDYAIEKTPPIECEVTSVCISVAEENTAVFSLAEAEDSLSREEQSEEAEKIYAIARVGDEVRESFRCPEVTVSLDVLAASQPTGETLVASSELKGFNLEQPESDVSLVEGVVDFMIGAVELGIHAYVSGRVARMATTEVYMEKNVQTAKCIFRRRFFDDEIPVEYGVSAKRRKSAGVENNLSGMFDRTGDELLGEFQSMDVSIPKSEMKTKTKRGRRSKKKDPSKISDSLTTSTFPSRVSEDLVSAEVNFISEYLRSDDQSNTGLSSLTHLEESFLDSPDLFGCGEVKSKRRRSKKEKRTIPPREEVVTRSKARALAAASSDKPRIVLRIKKHPPAVAVIQRRESDNVTGGGLGFFGKKLSNLIRHLKQRQLERSFFTTEEFGSALKRTAYDNIKYTLSHDSVVFTASRNHNHLISDFNLTMVRPKNPIVRFDVDTSPLMTSMNPASPIRLSLPRAEGSLEHAVEQFEKGIGCVLDQVDNARKIVVNLRDKMHWSLHFLCDAQLFLLDILYELWGFTARTVQVAVFSVYQTCLWEKHSELFDARMYCLLFELNASATLSCNIDTCASYLRRFEDWCRKSGNYTSIYNHVHGMALSLIKLIAVPDVLKRLQQMTLWNSKALPSKTTEEVFSMDLAPFFQVGTCPFKEDDFDLEKLLNARMGLFNCPLESLIGFCAAQGNTRSDAFSFLFPSHAVVELCRKQIFKEIESYYHSHDMKAILSLSNRDLYVLSPVARAYFVSRITESRAQGCMRNHIMNLEKLIERLNAAYSDLKANVEMQNQAEFHYPCGQVVFNFECGTVNVSINKPIPEPTPEPCTEAVEEARRIMGNAVDNTMFHPSTLNIQPDELSLKNHRIKKSVEAVRQWVASIQDTVLEDIENGGLPTADTVVSDDERMEVVYPSSPARVQVIDDEDDDTELSSCEEVPTKKCCDTETITTVIAGRKIQYAVDCDQGFLKMKTMDSIANDDSTDDLTATNTFSSASFSSFDQIETLKIIRSKETGELDWMAMIQNALEAAPPPETLPGFMLKKEPVDYKTLDVMKLHEHANHFVHETDEDGEFLDQRKEMREKIKPFQRVDYFERRRNARFEQLKSSTPLEMPRPGPGCLDQLPAYGIWVHQVVVYAELEKKRLMALKPVDNVGRCRAARSEMIRGFSVPSKQRKRSASAVYWLGRTMREHFGEYIEFGMSRMQYEKTSGKERNDARGFGSDDVITDYFVSRNNTPTTLVDPLELVENPYSYFRPTNVSRKRHLSPLLLESSLVKRFPECPVFAPLGMPVDEPETLYPPLDPNVLTSDDDDDDD
ncbi:hypothetical protein Y032_0072g679 [Ancylostoma ceylanicum]|nr:hypothetical protein Y032_0072g679 [Ancylostoma ceylanicum]